MTLEEYNDNLAQLADKTSRALSERIILTSGQRMLGSMHRRVFQKGLDSENSPIGRYSTTPGYYGPKQFIQKAAFSPVGKRGKKKFKSGDPHKTMYLKEGYKELREKQGRRTDIVNLEYRGDLEGSLKIQGRENDAVIGFDNLKESKIRKGNEIRFRKSINTIFPASEEERNQYSEDVIEQLEETERQILTGLQ
jgi:hypothetical protein